MMTLLHPPQLVVMPVLASFNQRDGLDERDSSNLQIWISATTSSSIDLLASSEVALDGCSIPHSSRCQFPFRSGRKCKTYKAGLQGSLSVDWCCKLPLECWPVVRVTFVLADFLTLATETPRHVLPNATFSYFQCTIGNDSRVSSVILPTSCWPFQMWTVISRLSGSSAKRPPRVAIYHRSTHGDQAASTLSKHCISRASLFVSICMTLLYLDLQ